MMPRHNQPHPFDDPVWRRYAEHVNREVVPHIDSSAVVVSIVPRGQVDVKFAVELGLSVMLDKPFIAVVYPGADAPRKLLRVADRVVQGTMDDPLMRERLATAFREILAEQETNHEEGNDERDQQPGDAQAHR